MKKTVLFSLAVLAYFSVTTLPNATARGKMPLPPAFSGGNVGAWLGRGPVLLLDSGMIGPGFGGSSGGGSGYGWDPWADGGMSGSGGGGIYLSKGNCWNTPPDSMMGPSVPICDCIQSNNVNYVRGVCNIVDRGGDAPECDHDTQVGVCIPPK